MSNQVNQALRNEQARMGQALSPDRLEGHGIEPAYARSHEVGLGVLEVDNTLRHTDPAYLAATATSGQVSVPTSAEVQEYEAQQFQQAAQDIDPGYLAAIAAPQDIVGTTPVAAQPQFEQPGA